MSRTAVKVDVRDARGREAAVEELDAAIDEAIVDNVILGQGFNYLQRLLHLERTPTGVKTLVDSRGVQYSASSTVTLLIGQSGGSWSAPAVFYISDSVGTAPGGGYGILLGNSLKARFSVPRADGIESYGAAPTVLHYKDQQERKQREEDAARNNPELRRKAKERQENLDKQKKERKDTGNGQSASTA
ncbi:hypothetical protein BJX66DRAFT_233953 [Aspergillus keveii]|uniref:Uncharacterized protein n=1 Tax=Aspergillus keveii TaxID=714993 RepID=A0ABR4G1S7_9EURO